MVDRSAVWKAGPMEYHLVDQLVLLSVASMELPRADHSEYRSADLKGFQWAGRKEIRMVAQWAAWTEYCLVVQKEHYSAVTMEYRKAVRRELLWADLKESLTVVRSVASMVEKLESESADRLEQKMAARKESR